MDLNRKADSNKYSEDMPAYPARVLATHVLVKGLQVGSILGVVAATPVLSYYRKAPFISTLKNVVPVSTGVFGVIALGMLYGKVYNGSMDTDGEDDRAFRISKNQGQNKVDKYSFIGSIAGCDI
jgi:hypothetical protein